MIIRPCDPGWPRVSPGASQIHMLFFCSLETVTDALDFVDFVVALTAGVYVHLLTDFSSLSLFRRHSLRRISSSAGDSLSRRHTCSLEYYSFMLVIRTHGVTNVSYSCPEV